jgi:hypothetical protein
VSLGRLLNALADGGVRFVIVGMVAGNIHGSQYVTEDLDIVYDPADDNVRALCHALEPLHPRAAEHWPLEGVEGAFGPALLATERSVTVVTTEGELNLLQRTDGIGAYGEVLAVSEPLTFDGRLLCVISLPALIASKRASGREKDQLHLPDLELIEELRAIRPEKD